MRNVGKQIRKIRTQKKLTQKYVATMLGYKYPSILSEIETGKKGLDADKIPLVAQILDVEINDLFLN